jgi:hypothetical protein
MYVGALAPNFLNNQPEATGMIRRNGTKKTKESTVLSRDLSDFLFARRKG